MLQELAKDIIGCALCTNLEHAKHVHDRAQQLIETQPDTHAEITRTYTSATIIALAHGRQEIAALFWPMAQMNEEDLEESFLQCVCWGYLECMEFLFPYCQHISMEQAMVVAAQKGSTACLKWLLDHANVDPTYNYSEALAQACDSAYKS